VGQGIDEVPAFGCKQSTSRRLHLPHDRTRRPARILQFLEQFFEQRDGELAIQIGLSDVHPSMSELSLISVRFELENGLRTHVAVLGPMRMNYTRAISAVLHVGQAFRGAALIQ
jgi:transcriptional regulator of heat shock response